LKPPSKAPRFAIETQVGTKVKFSRESKKWGEAQFPALLPVTQLATAKGDGYCLEGELGTEPKRRGSLHQQRRSVERIEHWWNSRYARVK